MYVCIYVTCTSAFLRISALMSSRSFTLRRRRDPDPDVDKTLWRVLALSCDTIDCARTTWYITYIHTCIHTYIH